MDLQVAKEIVKSAEALDLDVRLRESYSGRGMYGKDTAGVVGSEGDIVKAAAYTAWRFGHEVKMDLPEDMEIEDLIKCFDFRRDSMGYDIIAY